MFWNQQIINCILKKEEWLYQWKESIIMVIKGNNDITDPSWVSTKF
jgi:hypothetical protein